MDTGSHGKNVLVSGANSGTEPAVAPSPAADVAAGTVFPAGAPAFSATFLADVPTSSGPDERFRGDGGIVRPS